MSDGSDFLYNPLLFDWLQFEYEGNLSVYNEFKSKPLVVSFLHFSYRYPLRPLRDHPSAGCHRQSTVAMEMAIDLSIPLQVGAARRQVLMFVSTRHMWQSFKFQNNSTLNCSVTQNSFFITTSTSHFFKLLSSCDIKHAISNRANRLWMCGNTHPEPMKYSCSSFPSVKCLTRDTVSASLPSLGPINRVKLIPL